MTSAKRIAVNTLISYTRAAAALLFGLFSSRWLLVGLGETDYGLYGLVASVVSVVTFLNMVLEISVSRFYAVAIGASERDGASQVGEWFRAAVVIHAVLAAVILVVGWPVGEGLIRGCLRIPEARLNVCVWVLRCSVLSGLASIVAVPWTAMFSARQKFGELALYGIAQGLITTVVAGCLVSSFLPGCLKSADRLLLLTIVLAVGSTALSVCQMVRARVRFADCRVGRAEGEKILSVVVYAKWRILGIVGWMVQRQGGAFAVNLALGARANAAYAIGNSLATHAASLTSALASALTPALATASGSFKFRSDLILNDFGRSGGALERMALKGDAVSGFLAILLGVPLLVELDDVLSVWLVRPPEGTAALAIGLIAAMLVNASMTGTVAALSAETRIGRWQAFESLTLVVSVPVGWWLAQGGAGVAAFGWCALGASVVMTVGRLVFAKRMVGFAPSRWGLSVALPLVAAVVLSVGAAVLVRGCVPGALWRILSVGVASAGVTGVCGWGWGRRRCRRRWRKEVEVDNGGACPAPLAIFAFRRVETLRRVLAALARCENLTGDGRRAGYAYIDGPRSEKDAQGVAEVARMLEDFRRRHFPSLKIVCREVNLGNTVNMPRGIGEVLAAHGRIIVVEDDVVVSRYFLVYMDEMLEKYAGDARVWSVNGWRNRWVKVPRGYGRDVYLTPRCMCWGWGTWRDRWEAVDFAMRDWPAFRSVPANLEKVDEVGVELKWMLDRQYAGTLHAWDVQCAFHMIRNGLWSVEPVVALTRNIGYGTDCDHCVRMDYGIATAGCRDFLPRRTDDLTPDAAIYGQYRHAKVASGRLTRLIRLAICLPPYVWERGLHHAS